MRVAPITEIENDLYDAFVASHGGELYQSYAWGLFQEKIPQRGKFWAFAAIEGQEWMGSVLVVRHRLPFGLCWLSVARGPILSPDRAEEIWNDHLSNAIERLAIDEKAVFLRIEPPAATERGVDLWSFHTPTPWRKAHAHHHPEWTLKVDLTPSEESILAQMKPKGRYNIKVAQKKVTVRVTHDPKDVSSFYAVLKQTGERDGFGIHPETYYQDWVKQGHEAGWGQLFVAEHEGKIVSGIMATFFGDTAVYYYGASDYEHRDLMAPYLLQWTAMREAKARGFHWYDFLGIANPDEPDHPWKGITAFKEKFGGIKVQYPMAKELVLRKWWYALKKWRAK